MTISDLINAAQYVANRVTHYQHGGNVWADGGCDCIGLIYEAYRRAGGRWQGTVGSNASARHMMQGLQDIRSTTLMDGMVVYKVHPPNDPNWDLPDTYRGDPDQNDYYHIGIIVCARPLQILHCTTVEGGIKIDSAAGAWTKCGYLRGVESGMSSNGTVTPFGTMVDYGREIYAENGGAVNVRTGPGRSYKSITQLKVGTEVQVMYEVDGSWAYIRSGQTEGYVMREYLRVKQQEVDPAVEAQYNPEVPVPVMVYDEDRQYSGLTTETGEAPAGGQELLAEISKSLQAILDRINASLHG